jgi:hypothetical protein
MGVLGLSCGQARITALARTPLNNSPAAKKTRRFTPYRPLMRPPPGSYDPALDASGRASNRGITDLKQDIGYDKSGAPTGTQSKRAYDDWLLAQNRVNYQTGNTLGDILRQRGYEGQDYGTATGNLQRNYTNLANQQLQSANAAGVLHPGLDQHQAALRAGNQGLEQGTLDTAHSRAVTGFDIGAQRTSEAHDQSIADLGLGYQRGTEDRQQQLSRAQRENTFYQGDLSQSRRYESKGRFNPPAKPKGEHVVGKFAYRDTGHGLTVSKDGTVRTRNQLKRFLTRHNLR